MSFLVPPRLRRFIILLMTAICTCLGLFILVFPTPDLSQEVELVRQIADLSIRIQHAEQLNAERKYQLQTLFQKFSMISRRILQQSGQNSALILENLRNENALGVRLGLTAEAMLSGANQTYDLSVPSVHHFLPHLSHSPVSLSPAFKLAKQANRKVSMVIGIPTVKRTHQSYLQVTLKSVIDNMEEDEMNDCLIIVFVAETDVEFVAKVVSDIKNDFGVHVDSGLVEVISPPAEYYPDFSTLRQTLGDDLERVQWRSKQNLDYAFLMMYAHWRGNFYVQLEDDVLTKPGFFTIMKNFALDKSAAKDPWFLIDYCQLGFIGKLFKASDLPMLIQFFLMFYNDKPVDWLLENVLQTMVCKLDQDYKKCRKEKNKLWLHYKPSLFQHIGTHSSLKGKVQKLKDKQFGKIAMFVPHFNPPARVQTAIKHYKSYSITRAYQGETFYWGLVPQEGDTILFYLTPPTPLTEFKFISGNAEHPSDRFLNTDIEIFISEDENSRVPGTFSRTSDGYATVGKFDANGVAAGKLDPTWGPISHLRISIHSSSDNWVILSEIHLKTD
ncbi:alpha-1,3-mannosyl-glycoprotein 4-beta-N-acetylglucosaminyltransferase A-like [Tigriopus californicus]|nr:alpha-1,3-mannosyl-glycoprotein 4-beta-N-acetylglucosaminyltransferase A-like [Tigriopus californicus]